VERADDDVARPPIVADLDRDGLYCGFREVGQDIHARAIAKESIALNRLTLHQRTRDELQGILKNTVWCHAGIRLIAR
jgi:hypothetical protein